MVNVNWTDANFMLVTIDSYSYCAPNKKLKIIPESNRSSSVQSTIVPEDRDPRRYPISSSRSALAVSTGRGWTNKLETEVEHAFSTCSPARSYERRSWQKKKIPNELSRFERRKRDGGDRVARIERREKGKRREGEESLALVVWPPADGTS